MGNQDIMNQLFEVLGDAHGVDSKIYFEKNNQVFISEKDFFAIEVFGSKAVVRCHQDMKHFCDSKFLKGDGMDFVDGVGLFEIEEKVRSFGYELGGEHLRFLYTKPCDVEAPEGYTYKLYKGDELEALKDYKQFDNALNFKTDVIAFGAYYKDELVALAGADNYVKGMLQIGIDTMKDHRKKGLGRYLVNSISNEIVSMGYIPYYTTWSPNVASMNLAISIGYRPVWVEYFSRKMDL